MASLHYKKDKTSLVKSMYIALIPLIIFSFYKNGIHLWINDLANLTSLIPLIYFYGVSALIGFIVSKIYHEGYSENILTCLILASTISINTNYLIYPILLFASLFVLKYLYLRTEITFNMISIMRLFLILGLLINSYSYFNLAEKLGTFKFNLFDIFLGHGVGGIASTSAILVIISLVILCKNPFYKKRVALSSSISYFLVLLLITIISHSYDNFAYLLNGHAYFSFAFIASDLYTTPNNFKGMLIYGVMVGVVTGVITAVFNFYEASYLAIALLSLYIPLINNLTNKKALQMK